MMQRIAPEGTGTQKSEMSTSPMTRATCPLSLSANNATVHSQLELIYSWGRAICGSPRIAAHSTNFLGSAAWRGSDTAAAELRR
jgi:hypothetical protein